jgi:hypothetical protein
MLVIVTYEKHQKFKYHSNLKQSSLQFSDVLIFAVFSFICSTFSLSLYFNDEQAPEIEL